MSRPVRAVIVASHPVINGLVRLAFDGVPGAVVVAEAGSLAELRAVTEGVVADVLVLDLDLPDGDGLRFLREAESTGDPDEARPKVLVLSDRDDGAFVLQALRLGVTGYMTKSNGLRGLTAAIREVAAGGQAIPAELEAKAIAEVSRYARHVRERTEVADLMTPREREILAYLAQGSTMQQMGRRLGISARTVETHVTNVYRKLGVRTRVQAVSKAAALGLIDLG
jgi:DNA-binding NarL/FixJ family response regulator